MHSKKEAGVDMMVEKESQTRMILYWNSLYRIKATLADFRLILHVTIKAKQDMLVLTLNKKSSAINHDHTMS
jgi:hypothetical protein